MICFGRMIMMKKNKLDEMQEQKLLKIEHNGMWIAFWGLLAAILFQTIFEKGNFTGEWIVFMVMSLYTLDRKSTRLNSSHANISYAVFCLKKKKNYTSLQLPICTLHVS